MALKNHQVIENWSEEELLQLPEEENDELEYKSSQTSFDKLKNKISIAASAFWNTGGGIFIAGVDDKGKIDGGISNVFGKQKIRDWVDQVISGVEPVGPYSIKIIERQNDQSLIGINNIILVVAFGESYIGAHMAYDKKYYIRAGAHSGPASHFLVEAIRARRGLDRPLLRGVLKKNDTKPNSEQLVVLALNNAVALDVQITFEPFPKAFEEHFKTDFPLQIPAIDRNNPFIMEISFFGLRDKVFGENAVKLVLTYSDIAGREFKEEHEIDPHKNLGPLKIGHDISEEIKKAIEELTKTINNLNYNLSKK